MVVLAALAGGIVAAGLAWLYLINAAVEFGGVAMRGQGVAWLFTLGAAAGAVVCLALVLALVGRGLRTLGYLSDYKPRRAGARRSR